MWWSLTRFNWLPLIRQVPLLLQQRRNIEKSAYSVSSCLSLLVSLVRSVVSVLLQRTIGVSLNVWPVCVSRPLVDWIFGQPDLSMTPMLFLYNISIGSTIRTGAPWSTIRHSLLPLPQFGSSTPPPPNFFSSPSRENSIDAESHRLHPPPIPNRAKAISYSKPNISSLA